MSSYIMTRMNPGTRDALKSRIDFYTEHGGEDHEDVFYTTKKEDINEWSVETKYFSSGPENQIIEKENGNVYFFTGSLYNCDINKAVDLYHEHKDKFVDYIDGEYLFLEVNKETDKINIYTDFYGTRTGYITTTRYAFYLGSFGVGKFVDYMDHRIAKTPIETTRLKPNTHTQFDLYTNEIIETTLQREQQTISFEEAVLKRYEPDCTVISWGDKGSKAIEDCLNKHNLKFNSIDVKEVDIEEDSLVIEMLKVHPEMDLGIPKISLSRKKFFYNIFRHIKRNSKSRVVLNSRKNMLHFYESMSLLNNLEVRNCCL